MRYLEYVAKMKGVLVFNTLKETLESAVDLIKIK